MLYQSLETARSHREKGRKVMLVLPQLLENKHLVYVIAKNNRDKGFALFQYSQLFPGIWESVIIVGATSSLPRCLGLLTTFFKDLYPLETLVTADA